MITEVTQYEAGDGSLWNTPERAKQQENLIATVDNIMAKLPKLDISGTNFYQHIPADVLSVQATIAKLAYIALGRESMDKHLYDAVVYADKPMGAYSIIGRFLDDNGGPLNSAWGRIMCIDLQYREWEQPYYTLNTPTDAIEIKTQKHK